MLLYYNNEGKSLTHVLGEIEEDALDTAKAWVNRVNQIYTNHSKKTNDN